MCKITAGGADIGLSNANFRRAGIELNAINLYSGEFFLEDMDLLLSGPHPLVFKRYYASRLDEAGRMTSGLGRNWTHNYQMHLTQNGRRVKISTHKGRVLRFLWDPDADTPEWRLEGPHDVSAALKETEEGFRLFMAQPQRFYTFKKNYHDPMFVYADPQRFRLDQISDLAGNSHYLAYDIDTRQIVMITDDKGRSITLSYAGAMLESVASGILLTNFEYSEGNLAAVLDWESKATEYEYVSSGGRAGLLSAIRPPRGFTPITLEYDSGFIVRHLDSRGNTHTITYGSPTIMTDPLGQTRRYTHTGVHGELLKLTDEAGNDVEMEYDDRGRRKRLLDRLDNETHFVYADMHDGLMEIVEADQSTLNFEYVTKVIHDFEVYLPRRLIHADGTEHNFVYDNAGNIRQLTDPEGHTWTYTHNPFGQTLTETDPRGGVVQRTYHPNGDPDTITDPMGNTKTLHINAFGRLESVAYADGTSWVIGWAGPDRIDTITDEAGRVTTFEYDVNGNLIQEVDPAGNVTQYAYDELDRHTATTVAGATRSVTYDALWRLKTHTDAEGAVTTFDYNAIGQVKSIREASGAEWRADHDAEGNIISYTNAGGKTDTFAVDEVGRITGITDSDGRTDAVAYDSMGRIASITNPLGQQASYTYDGNGRPKTVNMPGGVNAVFERDEVGNLIRVHDPDGEVWEFEPDAAGRMMASIDPSGRRTQYAYDIRNRLNHIIYPGGMGETRIATDGSGVITGFLYTSGEIVETKQTEGEDPDKGEREAPPLLIEVPIEPDAEGRPATGRHLALVWDSASDQIANSNGIGIEYDALKLIKRVDFAPQNDGFGEVDYTWENGRITEIKDWTSPRSIRFTYYPDSRPQLVRRGNNVRTFYTYLNSEGVPGLIDEMFEGDQSVAAAPRQVSRMSIGIDAAGKVVDGNFAQTPLPVPERPAAFRQYTPEPNDKIQHFLYDFMGHLIDDGQNSYGWDATSSLVRLTERIGNLSFETTYTYDALGFRVARRKHSVTHRYVWNYAFDPPVLAMQTSDSGEPEWYYVHSPSGIPLYRIDAATEKRYYYHYLRVPDSHLS